MALNLQDPVRAKQQALAVPGLPSRLAILVVDFFSVLIQHCGAPDLQVIPFNTPANGASPGDNVDLADAACRVYAIVIWNVQPGVPGEESSFEIDRADASTAFQDYGEVNGQGKFEHCQFFPSGVGFEVAETPLQAAPQDSEPSLTGFILVGAPA